MGWALEVPWLSALVTWRLRRISTRGYVENLRRCALVKRLFEIFNPGVVSRKLINCSACLGSIHTSNT